MVVIEARFWTHGPLFLCSVYFWSFYIMKTLEPWLVGSMCPVHCASLYRIQDYPWLVRQLSKVRLLYLIYVLLSLSTLPASSPPLTVQLQFHCWKPPLTSDLWHTEAVRSLMSTPTTNVFPSVHRNCSLSLFLVYSLFSFFLRSNLFQPPFLLWSLGWNAGHLLFKDNS